MKVLLRIFFVSMILIVPYLNVDAQGSLTISGNIDRHFNGRTIVIERVYPFPTTLSKPKATCVVQEGKFLFNLSADALEQYYISIIGDTSQNDAVSLVLMPERTEINFMNNNLVSYNLVGNTNTLIYKNSLLPLLNRAKYTQDEVIKAITGWIENHEDSPLNAYLIFTNLLNHVTDSEILRLYKLIPPFNKKGTYYNQLHFITSNLYLGCVLPDFQEDNAKGISVKLSSFRGKYVLVDFWASWCIPCRAENPQLVEAVQKYGHKNFRIICVSLDNEKKLWQEAIRKDGLKNWTHVSDLRGWNNSVALTYRIRAIPRNFLLDPEGKIIAKNLRGKEILDLLNKVIN